jgi:hypothetical protein
MLKTKPKNSLKLKVSLSSVVSIIVEKIKTEIKELDIDTIRKDIETLVYIMELIDEALANKDIIDNKTSKRVDKTELLTIILKKLFPDINDEILSSFDPMVEFILNNNLIKKQSVITSTLSSCSKFFFSQQKG